jgi:ClpP class serine protease
MQNKSFKHIRAAIYGQPLAISEGGLDLVCGIIEAHEAGKIPETIVAAAGDSSAKKSKVQMVGGNAAIVPIMGPIVPRASFFSNVSGMTSSQEIMDMIDEAVAAEVRTIAYKTDSPGGSVQLGFEVADKMFAIKEAGKITQITCVQGQCCSLAYLFASQTDQIIAGVDSMLGSVSVIMRAESSDRQLRNEGTDILTMTTGSLKRASDPSSISLTSQFSAIIGQAKTYHEMFVGAIQRSRPAMNIPLIETGDVWIGKKAVDAGLADKIGTMQQLISDLSA